MDGLQSPEQNRWKHYLPSLICIGIVFFVLLFPSFVVFLLVMGLVGFALVYALVIFKIHQAQDRMTRFQSSEEARPTDEEWAQMEPEFRRVTVFMIQRKNFFDDLSP